MHLPPRPPARPPPRPPARPPARPLCPCCSRPGRCEQFLLCLEATVESLLLPSHMSQGDARAASWQSLCVGLECPQLHLCLRAFYTSREGPNVLSSCLSAARGFEAFALRVDEQPAATPVLWLQWSVNRQMHSTILHVCLPASVYLFVCTHVCMCAGGEAGRQGGR